jgi:hypothetical protein
MQALAFLELSLRRGSVRDESRPETRAEFWSRFSAMGGREEGTTDPEVLERTITEEFGPRLEKLMSPSGTVRGPLRIRVVGIRYGY